MDLKDIDVSQISEQVSQYKNAILIVMVLIAIGVGLTTIYNNYQSQYNQKQSQIAQIENKIIVIADYRQKVKELNTYAQSLPEELVEEAVITEITNFAAKNNIQIKNFTPGQKTSQALYDLTKIQLSLITPDYQNIVSFMKSIEDSSYALRVNSLVFQPQEGTVLGVEMDIGSIKVNK